MPLTIMNVKKFLLLHIPVPDITSSSLSLFQTLRGKVCGFLKKNKAYTLTDEVEHERISAGLHPIAVLPKTAE